MPRIFISYRRDDASAYAGRIYDRLSTHFGADNVFMDIDTLEPGVDFVQVLQEMVDSCDIFLSVIGRQWLTVKDEDGRPRLSNPEDFVALETRAALQRQGLRVVPILVGNARMPKSTELPKRLSDLARRHALVLPDIGFHQTLGNLIQSIERVESERIARENVQPTAPRPEDERIGRKNPEPERVHQENFVDRNARRIIGIDLGTTSSRVAVVKNGLITVIPNEERARRTPSVVAFTKTGARLVGQVAKSQSVTDPRNTIFSIKRFMGRRIDEVRKELKMVPYKVVRGDNDDARVEIEGRNYTPPEISAMILVRLKEVAETYLDQKVTEAVITVPASFNDAQRQATRDAGKIAGLDVKRIINAPTAAALTYSLDKKAKQTIAIYDFGGGMFDVSILEVGDGVVEVKSTNGDTRLGGDEIDERVMDWIVDQLMKKQGVGIDLSKDRVELQKIREAAGRAKIDLSTQLETDISLPFIATGAGGPKHLTLKLTRSRFEAMCEDIFQRSVGPCKQALLDAGITPDKIDAVLSLGGSSRIPRVETIIKQVFHKEPDNKVNPDELVAVGAAIHGGVLMGEMKDVLLFDVTPVSLGIETLGGVFTKLIDRNTPIPARTSEIFSTAAENQTSVEIKVFQGERAMAKDNRLLGVFQLAGIPPAPRGVPQIEVTFDLDANGILSVSAKDKGNNNQHKITISSSSGLSKDDVEKMAKDAESHAAGDRRAKEQIEARNRADSMVYNVEKSFKAYRGKIGEEVAKAIEAAIEDVKQTITGVDPDEMNAATDRLAVASHKLAEAMYKSSGQ